MNMPQSPLRAAAVHEISVRSGYVAPSDLQTAHEDGCTVRRTALRASDPGMWCVLALLAAATAWLMG